MKYIQVRLVLVSLMAAVLLPAACMAQDAVHGGTSSKIGIIGIGIKMSALGAGAEAAIPLGSKLNVRGGFNAISYSHTFNKDGIQYAGNLSWRSGEANLDFFPFGHRFHLSPGLLWYNGNQIHANASVPGGQTFTLNGTTYTSSASDPVNGTGKLDFTKAAPTFRLGYGNLIPRNGHHWSFLAELGVAYQGSPRTALALRGSACDPNPPNLCVNAATDPTVQANVQAEQTKINNDLTAFKFYPLISFGVGYSF